MLNDGDAAAIRGWVEAADRWSRAAQELVRAATELATVSRNVGSAVATPEWGDEWTVEDLERLAAELESDTGFLRDRYLATAAGIEQYRDVLD